MKKSKEPKEQERLRRLEETRLLHLESAARDNPGGRLTPAEANKIAGFIDRWDDPIVKSERYKLIPHFRDWFKDEKQFLEIENLWIGQKLIEKVDKVVKLSTKKDRNRITDKDGKVTWKYFEGSGVREVWIRGCCAKVFPEYKWLTSQKVFKYEFKQLSRKGYFRDEIKKNLTEAIMVVAAKSFGLQIKEAYIRQYLTIKK